MRESLAALAMLAEPSAPPQIVRSGETSLEGLVREMLRPMLAAVARCPPARHRRAAGQGRNRPHRRQEALTKPDDIAGGNRPAPAAR
jgi:hypothetical protein